MTQVQGSGSLLDVLKKKMRLTKEEMEKYKEESEDMGRKLQVEIMRREEVMPREQTPLRVEIWETGGLEICGMCNSSLPANTF